MKIYQTNHQKEMAKYPSKLEFEEVAFRRGLLKTEKEMFNYYRTVAGEEGEKIVLEYLKKYGKNHWTVVNNLWQNYSGPLESDLILFTRNKLYVFEIKNYTGAFSYEEGSCKINGRPITSNPFHQVRRAATSLKNICLENGHAIAIQGAVIFVGIDNPIEINSEISDLDIIPRTRLLTYLEKIIDEENQHTGKIIDPVKVLTALEKYEIADHFLPKPITNEEMKSIQRGMCCESCNSFNIVIKRFKVICIHCNHVEVREHAVVRTICDYGVLHFESHLKLKQLFDFFDGEASLPYLKKILRNHFIVVKNGAHTYYVNKKSPLIKISNQFIFN